jgi:hypothetical protein
VFDSSLKCGLNALLNRDNALPRLCLALQGQKPRVQETENVRRKRNGVEGAARHFHLPSPKSFRALDMGRSGASIKIGDIRGGGANDIPIIARDMAVA